MRLRAPSLLIAAVLALAACAPATPATLSSSPAPSAATSAAAPPSAQPPAPVTPRASASAMVEDLAVPATAADFQWEGSQRGGCDRPSWPPASADAAAQGKGRRVLVIGDSLVREIGLQSEPGTPTSPALLAALSEGGWTPTVVCWKGRTTQWALDQVRLLDSAGLLPPRVVIATGTNDMWVDDATPAEFRQRVQSVLRALAESTSTDGSPPQVWWVNLWVDKAMAAWNHAREPRDPDMAGYEAYNGVLEQECTQAVRCTVIDWHGVVSGDEGLAVQAVEPDLDGVHLSAIGSQERAGVIAGALR